jgi:nucleoside-diphosphate-sugar epimerase
MARRILVTGGAGFLGRHLVAALAAEGAPTVALCRRPDDLADLRHPALAVVAGDLRDDSLGARLLDGVGTVYHLAAVRSRPGASPAEMSAVNEIATVRLARQAIDAGVDRFVQVSTAMVFGPSSTPLDETAPLVLAGGASAYAESKARAIPALRELARAGAPIVTLFPTLVFGPDHPSRPNRVTAHIRRLLGRRFDVAVAGGRAARDLVHVADVVAALRAAAANPGAVGREILLPGEPVSQRRLGELVARAVDRPPPLLFSLPVFPCSWMAKLADRAFAFDRRSGWALAVANLGREWRYRGERARELLDFRPRPLEEAVAQTVEWIRGGGR